MAFLLIDTHTHTKPISSCSWVESADIPHMFKAVNFDGFMLSNHFNKAYLGAFGDNYSDQVKSFIACHNEAERVAKEIGIKIFFGAEVKVNDYYIDDNGETKYFYPEFLMFGLTKEKLLKSPVLYSISPKELFDFANSENILLYQTHPYRVSQGYKPANPKYMHGVEVFNGHPHFDPMIDKTLEFATNNNLLMSAGSDMHIEKQAGKAGIVIPNFIETSEDLAEFLKQNTPKKLDEEKFILEF